MKVYSKPEVEEIRFVAVENITYGEIGEGVGSTLPGGWV